MTVTTTTLHVQPVSKAEIGLVDDLVADVSHYVDRLDFAIDDLVRALEAFDDDKVPASVSELAADMLREAEEIRSTFDSGDLPGQANELEALAEEGEGEADAESTS